MAVREIVQPAKKRGYTRKLTKLEEEPVTENVYYSDIELIIRDCLSEASLEGTPWKSNDGL